MTTREKCAHLLRKFAFGVTPAELDACEQLGVKGTIDWLVDYEKVEPAPEFRPWNLAYDKVDEQPKMDPYRFAAYWALRMVTTTRPLEENLTLFWHNHFAVSGAKVTYGPMLVGYMDTLREHAAGNFRTMLGEVSRDPAMIRWLDTDTNIKGRPNENFAREIMELFTLGIGNYTEKDIQEATRAFTGWSLRNALPDAARIPQNVQLRMAIEDERPIIVFTDSPALRDKKNKTILGKTDAFDADGVMDLLVAQPTHAKFLMKKLWSYFVYPNPDPKLIDQMAKVYVAGKYEIKPVLKWMMNSKEFWSEKATRSVVKSPAHYTIGVARQAGVGKILVDSGALKQNGLQPMEKRAVDVSRGLLTIMRRQGMYLLFPPDVAGWEWGPGWITTASVIERNKIGTYLFTAGSGTPAAILQRIQAKGVSDTAGLVDLLVEWFDVPVNAEAKTLMAQSIEANGGFAAFAKPNTAVKPIQAFWRLASSVPEFQML